MMDDMTSTIESTIEIRYNTLNAYHGTGSSGKMSVALHCFFPASQANVRKLMKTIRSDVLFSRVRRNTEQILNYLNSAIIEFKAAAKECADEHVDARTRAAEIKEEIKWEKFTNGLPMTKEDLKKAREELKEYNRQVAGTKAYFGKLQTRVRRLQANMQLIQQLTAERW